ncbi:MAG: porin family protein [Bacteroidaceae bacterium]|jgi:hypothetical protein|nr:hypothetical protein [Bacteroidales bacterium]HPB03572.1 porin family protein [Bacteroidaceae bacterium]
MKRSLLVISLFLLTTLPSKAQVGDSRNLFSIGFNGGLGTSSVSFIPTIKQDISLGPTAGLTIRHISEKYFFLICGLQLECNYATRGWTELIDDGSGNEYTRHLNYVEVPFYAHLGFGREYRGFQGYLNLGPQVSYLINEIQKKGGREPWDSSNRPNRVIYHYNRPIENKLDYGISAGLGVELRTGIGAFGLEGRYYFGLGNIYNITKSDYFARCANSTISVRATYLISIK